MTDLLQNTRWTIALSLLVLLASSAHADLPKHGNDLDHGYPCVVAPLPTEAVGEHRQFHFDDLGLAVQAWRYPCDGDRSVPMLTLIPEPGGAARFCPSDGVMIQDMQQSNHVHLLQDPMAPESFCGNVLVPTTLAMVRRGSAGHRFDFDRPFSFMLDAQHRVDYFGYHAADYGVDSMGHAIGRHSGLTGVWYDPLTAGQGFSIQMTPSGLVVFYFGYDANGDRLWLISSLEEPPLAYSDSITMLLYRGSGGIFGQPLPDVEAWGELTLSFSACGEGTAVLDGQDGYVEMTLVKLAGINGLDCF